MNGVKNRFKTPEGGYLLAGERPASVGFNPQRCTRLCLANLQGGAEQGLWVLYNIGESLHIAQHDSTYKEPKRSLLVGNATTRAGLPSCMDWAHAKDGIDTLVGTVDGQVLLLSLRAQIQALTNKPTIATTLTPEPNNECSRCVAVAWLPRTDGVFAAAFASGTIYVFRKSSLFPDSSSSKFSLSLGTSSKASMLPTGSFSIGGGGINDLAPSPCGTRLAAACRDGAVRLVDATTGSVVGGFQSFYGAMLCCCYSSDGKYVAAGGEDDLVAVYSVADRCLVAHCEGHNSWVSRVVFDPWLDPTCCTSAHTSFSGAAPPAAAAAAAAGGSGTPTGGSGSALGSAGGIAKTSYGSSLPGAGTIYRLASVGQDATLCLWDVQIQLVEGDMFAMPVVANTMRKSTSQASMQSPARNQTAAPAGSVAPGHSLHQRKPSMGRPALQAHGGITPALHHEDMNIVQPIMQHRVHLEPACEVKFTEGLVLTADHAGCVRTWLRPGPNQRLSTHRQALLASVGSAG